MSFKKYSVIVPQQVSFQIERIYTHIAVSLSSPESAARQCLRIWDTIDSLATLPERHAIYHDKLRRVNVGNYTILYKVDSEVVIIEAVLYQRQNIADYL